MVSGAKKSAVASVGAAKTSASTEEVALKMSPGQPRPITGELLEMHIHWAKQSVL